MWPRTRSTPTGSAPGPRRRRAQGWFADDFTLAELKRLTARERYPDLRPASATYDGTCGIPSFNEVLAMVHAESARSGRTVGVMAELKHAATTMPSGCRWTGRCSRTCAATASTTRARRVTVMSFETTVLRRLAGQTGVPLVQLLDDADCRPPDLAAVGDPTTYADLCTPEGLARIDEYADGIGPRLALVLPRDADDNVTVPSTLVRDAHRLWLTVHVWTLRRENRFLPANLRAPGDPRRPETWPGWPGCCSTPVSTD